VKKLSFVLLGGLVLVFALGSVAQAANTKNNIGDIQTIDSAPVKTPVKEDNNSPVNTPVTPKAPVKAPQPPKPIWITDTVQDLFPFGGPTNLITREPDFPTVIDPTPFLKVVASNYFRQNYGVAVNNPAIVYGCWADYCYWTVNAILWNNQANSWYVYRLYLDTDGSFAHPNGQPETTAGPLPTIQGSVDVALVVIEEPCAVSVCSNIREMGPYIQQIVEDYNGRYAHFMKTPRVIAPPFNLHLDIFFARASEIPNYLDQQAVINYARKESGGHDYKYTVAFDVNVTHTNNSHSPLGCAPSGNYLDYSTYPYSQTLPVNWMNMPYPGKTALWINLRGLFEHEFFGHCLGRWEHEWGGNEATMFWNVGNPFMAFTAPSLLGATDQQDDGMSPFLSPNPYNPRTTPGSAK
jgi:hypothetical protein